MVQLRHSDKSKFPFRFNIGSIRAFVGIELEWLNSQTTLNQRVPGSSPGAPTK